MAEDQSAAALHCGGQSSSWWTAAKFPLRSGPRLFGLRHRSVVRIVFVEGFLEVVLQFLLRLPAALTNSAHLLRCRSGVGVLVWAVI